MRIYAEGKNVVTQCPRGQRSSFNAASEAQAQLLAREMQFIYGEGILAGQQTLRWKFGWLFNKGSAWMGVHYSQHNKRWCINLLPCLTVWITKPGGKAP